MINCLLLASLFLSATTSPSAVPPSTTATNAPSPLLLREISPDIFEYKQIRLDRKNHQISFPATVNQRVGSIEYLLVNDKGKTHESLFSTALLPHDIHLAMLLIGLHDNSKINAEETEPPPAIDEAYLQTAPKLKGTPVNLSVSWADSKGKQEVAAEDWVSNLQTKKPMSRGTWIYNGSLIQDGVFLADSELSLIAVITDPTALVNNTRPGYDNDEIWQARDDVIPPLDTPVVITVSIAGPATSGKP
jgi:hypothetical protein